MEQISLPSESDFDVGQFLKSLHLLTGMAVTLYNSHKLWVMSYPNINCDFCKVLRENKCYLMRCRANDAEALNLCAKKGSMIVYRCYMGLYEMIIPLYDQDSICGYLMLGQAMDDRLESRSKYLEELASVQPAMSADELEKIVDGNLTFSEEKILAVAHVAQIYANHVSDRNLLKEEVDSLANLVAVYIREHLTEKITNAELCYVFLCDRKKMAGEFKKAYGMTIVEYTNHLRLRLARQMLQKNPDLTISYVSSAAGFTYQGYFSTLFYKKYGMSPTDMQRKYREEMKNQSPKEE